MNEIAKLENKVAENNNDAIVTEDDQNYSKYVSDGSESENQLKVLGVGWDNNTDMLQLELREVSVFARTLPPTIRSVLRIATKIFDPMGIYQF